MSKGKEKIYDSAPSAPDDDYWLAQGKNMLSESLPNVREAAKSLMTGLGIIKDIYLGILGFVDFIPKTLALHQKDLFIVPLLFWLVSLYSCILVRMTKKLEIFLHSPDDIREKSTKLLLQKQCQLHWAFWTFAIGLLVAFLLLIVRLQITG